MFHCSGLIKHRHEILSRPRSEYVTDELMPFGTTVREKGHEAYGLLYKDVDGMKAATKITFD